MIRPPSSITHAHLLSILNTELAPRDTPEKTRVLDIGCGNGLLMSYLHESLPCLLPGREIEIHGFDVVDHGVQSASFIEKTVSSLSDRFPDVAWESRVSAIYSSDAWPYPDGHFAASVSNQVVEHVQSHDFFFSQVHRTLTDGGFSAHLFPLKHYFYEGHLHLPLVHRIGDHDLLVDCITLLSRLGLGKYRAHHRQNGVSLAEFAEKHADYMTHLTSYLSYGEALAVTKRNQLRASFRYTPEFYTSKLRSLLRRPPVYRYRTTRRASGDWLATHLLKFLSCVTLFVVRKQTYGLE